MNPLRFMAGSSAAPFSAPPPRFATNRACSGSADISVIILSPEFMRTTFPFPMSCITVLYFPCVEYSSRRGDSALPIPDVRYDCPKPYSLPSLPMSNAYLAPVGIKASTITAPTGTATSSHFAVDLKSEHEPRKKTDPVVVTATANVSLVTSLATFLGRSSRSPLAAPAFQPILPDEIVYRVEGATATSRTHAILPSAAGTKVRNFHWASGDASIQPSPCAMATRT
mmetsp:Transcript_3411/g.10493  ORF Transcript_3411/g.10493 Transcript_3411/m.10493 type:complete len:226 (+) Transcript_3411:7707-8384(+)